MRRMWTLVLMALPLLAPMAGQAEDAKIGNCEVAYHGIGTKPEVLAFIGKLQAAVKAEKKAEVAAMVSYPLKVKVNGKQRTLQDAAAFEKAYAAIMTKPVRDAITGQKLEALFCNSEGAMLGNGEIWFRAQVDGKDKGRIKVFAINN